MPPPYGTMNLELGPESAPETGAQEEKLHLLEHGNSSLRRSIPRLIHRNLEFHQSSNIVRVSHNKRLGILSLLRHDWFHVFLRQPTFLSVFALISVWTAAIMIFAAIYVRIDGRHPNRNCGLGLEGKPISFRPAFAFSLETSTTVGYGLPNSVNSFFEKDCTTLQLVIFFQMVWAMMFNAFVFAFFYNRLGRVETRGAQVVFSNKAIVNIEHGQVRFQFRIFDVDARYPVVEAHVRIYAVSSKRPIPRILRILQPDDALGSMLLLSLPTVVTHHIDIYSMLHPPVERPVDSAGLSLRQVDASTICPICGTSFSTHENWIKHVRYQQIVEAKDGYPFEGSHLSIEEEARAQPLEGTQNLAELRDYFKEEIAEIVCVVEGTDPLMSGTFQALQSYRLEDIEWNTNVKYEPCLQVNGTDFQVDLDAFHRLNAPPPELRASKIHSYRSHDSLCEGKCSDSSRG